MENKLTSPAQNSFMANYEKTDDILKDMCGIIESSRDRAYKAVNIALIQRNWLIGYRIAEEEVKGADRAEYGLGVMKKLAKDKMLRALSNVAYAKGDYEKEMGQAALKKEAKLRTK